MIVIKFENNQSNVYKDGSIIGKVKNFCCGCDFRPNHRPKAIFSILKLKENDTKLLTCIESIMKINIPENNLHVNFRYETAKDEVALKEYESQINKVRGK